VYLFFKLYQFTVVTDMQLAVFWFVSMNWM